MTATDDTQDMDEQAFLAAYDADNYARPSVAVDVVLLTVADDRLEILLVRRTQQPQLGLWSIPGGFVRMEESLDIAAQRILTNKVGLKRVFTEQLYTFGEPHRDPRTRVISVVYYALVEAARLHRAVPSRDDRNLRLARVLTPDEGQEVVVQDQDGASLPLAFDHAEILTVAVERIRGKLGWAPIGFELLPEAFSLRDLRLVHEAILGRPLNKDSFRRKILDGGLIVATGERASGLGHRPPELYRFARKADRVLR